MAIENSILSSLLDTVLDDIADLPSYENFAPGAYLVTINFEATMSKDKPIVKVTLTVQDTVELEDPTGTPPKTGDACIVRYDLTNEYGLMQLGAIGKVFAAYWNKERVSLAELVKEADGATVLVITGVRVDKKDSSKQYMQIKKIVADLTSLGQ